MLLTHSLEDVLALEPAAGHSRPIRSSTIPSHGREGAAGQRGRKVGGQVTHDAVFIETELRMLLELQGASVAVAERHGLVAVSRQGGRRLEAAVNAPRSGRGGGRGNGACQTALRLLLREGGVRVQRVGQIHQVTVPEVVQRDASQADVGKIHHAQQVWGQARVVQQHQLFGSVHRRGQRRTPPTIHKDGRGLPALATASKAEPRVTGLAVELADVGVGVGHIVVEILELLPVHPAPPVTTGTTIQLAVLLSPRCGSAAVRQQPGGMG